MPAHHFVSPEFPHRMNKNGTIDSICPLCFTTVGCSTWEADLDRIEAAHVCEPARLRLFTEHRRIVPVAERQFDQRDHVDRKRLPSHNIWLDAEAASRKSA